MKMMLKSVKVLALTASSMLLLACQQTNMGTQASNAVLQKKHSHINTGKTMQNMTVSNEDLLANEWQLLSASDSNGSSIVHLTNVRDKVSLVFTERSLNGNTHNQVGFSAGCNTKSAGYQLSSDGKSITLVLSPIMSTRMACQGDTQKAENYLTSGFAKPSQLALKQGQLTQTFFDGATLVWASNAKT